MNFININLYVDDRDVSILIKALREYSMKKRTYNWEKEELIGISEIIEYQARKQGYTILPK